MDIKYVENHTIFECIVGSRAYGTNTPNSDCDIAGVMIPDKTFFFGTSKFEQFQGFLPSTYNNIRVEDKTIYDIRKAISLITDNNPNMLDLLATPDHCIIKTTKYWDTFRENKQLFISKRCKFTYSGYSAAQIRRIKTHRKFLLEPLVKEPIRSDFGLKNISIFPSVQLKSIMYSVTNLVPEHLKTEFTNELDKLYGNYLIPLITKYLPEKTRIIAMELLQSSAKSQANTLTSADRVFIKDEYIEEAQKELAYFNAKKEWDKYEEWKKHRNKERAETEKKFGWDTKHGSHCVRLIRMAKEILETGKINVDRTNIDADELKAIRNGQWSYEQLENYTTNMENQLEQLYKTSTLQKSPQINKINDILISNIDQYLQ